MIRRRFGLGSRVTRRARASQFLYILSFADPPRLQRRRHRPRRPHPVPGAGSAGVARIDHSASNTKRNLIAAPARVRELEDA